MKPCPTCRASRLSSTRVASCKAITIASRSRSARSRKRMLPHRQRKIHGMDANHATQIQDIVLDDGAYLECMPDPMIPHKHSRFLMQTRLVIAPSAALLYGEILLPGRKHYGDGELFGY